jgi:hypothetical protein
MPYETIQFPRATSYDLEEATELSVHWGKESWVQIEVERYTDLAATNPGGPLAGMQGREAVADGKWVDISTPEPRHQVTDPIPCGSVKVADTQVAYKTRSAHQVGDGGVGSVKYGAEWTILRMSGSVEKCTEDSIQDWPIVHFGDGTAPPAKIISQPLDRGQINNMIRVLRRARDAAYGADA